MRNSERQSCYNGHSRLGIEELGVTWKKPLPNPLPIPIGSQNFGIGSENRDLLSQHVYVLSHLLQKPLPILTPDPDPDFFVESHSRFCQKIGSDPKMKFRTLSTQLHHFVLHLKTVLLL